MDSLLVLLIAYVLLGPALAVVLAWIALVKLGRLRRQLDELKAAASGRAGPSEATDRSTADAARPTTPADDVSGEDAVAGPADHERVDAGTAPPTPPRGPGIVPPAELPTAEGAAADEAAAAPSKGDVAARTATDSSPAGEAPRREPPAPKVTLEERLGSHLAVVVGGIACALAGTFLVKYWIDRGFITPPVRLAAGLVFGSALLGLSELTRARRLVGFPAVLAGAGVFVLYASLWAGVNLYALVDPFVGFALMALVTGTAIALSLRHGPFVAALGLVGGYLAPVLAGTAPLSTPTLFAWLLLLEGALLVLTHHRRWGWLALLTVAATGAWTVWWVLGELGRVGPWLGFTLVASAALAVAAARVATPGTWGRIGGVPVRPLLTWLGVGVALLVAVMQLPAGGFATRDWLFFALLCAGSVAAARLLPQAAGLAVLSLVFALVVVEDARWPSDEPGRFLAITGLLLAIHAGGAWLALWGSRRPAAWGAIASVAAVGFVVVGWHQRVIRDVDVFWGAVSLGVAAVLAGGVAFVQSRRHRFPEAPERWASGVDATLAALAAGVVGLVSLAVPFELEREWIGVGWALELPALALVERRLGVRALRWLAAVVGAGVLVRLCLNPWVLDYPIGETPLLNWLLYGYGVPAAAFAVAARLFARARDDRWVAGLELGASLLGATFVLVSIRHWFHSPNLDESGVVLAEWGVATTALLVLAAAAVLARARAERWSLAAAGTLFLWGGVATAWVGLGIVDCPAWSREYVGEARLFNRLVVAYLVPTLAAALAARAVGALRRREDVDSKAWKAAEVAARLSALVGAFAFVTLEVRQWFRGAYLAAGRASAAEQWTTSAAWAIFGIGLLVVGVRFGSSLVRHAALLVVGLTACKVFLVDLRELEDLWRVLSFFGLGASLLVLGWIYQRFVFRKPS